MRLLIVGICNGQIGAAAKIAMDRGAKVGACRRHRRRRWRGLRAGHGADLVMFDVTSTSAAWSTRSQPNASTCRWSPAASAPMPAAAVDAIRAGAKEYSRCRPTPN